MRVRDLVEALSRMPQELPVTVEAYTPCNGGNRASTPERVEKLREVGGRWIVAIHARVGVDVDFK